MSCEGVITPPLTPPKKQRDNEDSSNDVHPAFSKESNEPDVQWFVCQGDICQDNSSLQSVLKRNCFLGSGESTYFTSVPKTSPQTSIHEIQLFGQCFDSGSALVERTDYLFQNVRKILLKLEQTAHPQKFVGSSNNDEERYRRYRSKIRKFRLSTRRTKVLDYFSLRKQIVEFCVYVRNFVIQIHTNSEESPFTDELVPKLVKQLSSLHQMLGSVSTYPQYVFDKGAAFSKNTSIVDEHHLCHLHLDLEWLSITIAYVLALVDDKRERPARVQTEDIHSINLQPFPQDGASTMQPSIKLLDQRLNHLLCDLLHLSAAKFRNVEGSLSSSSPFSCSCVFQLWLLSCPVSTVLSNKFQLKPFWERINETLIRILDVNHQKSTSQQSSKVSDPDGLNESSLPVFDVWVNVYSYVFWMLFHLTKVLNDSKLSNSELDDNYRLLESVLRKSLEEEKSQSMQLRECLAMMETLTTEYWKPRSSSSVILILWDYFQRSLDQGFLVQGEQLHDQWPFGESALSFLNQVEEIVETGKFTNPSSLTIFKQFLRILASHLRRCNDTPEVWNRIKGRIFSKFSARKISNLSELGLIHFFALFLTLAMVGDTEEVCKVTGGMMSEVDMDRRMPNRRKVLWKGYLAMALLALKKERKIDSLVPPMIQLINADLAITDSERMLPIFFEAFREILIVQCGLKFGQLLLIDSWIEKCITSSSEPEKNNLLSICYSLLCILNAELFKGEFKIDSGETKINLWQLQVKLWKHLIPHLTHLSSKPRHETTPQFVGELLAAFINFSLKIGLNEVRTEKVKELFIRLLKSESVQIGVMKGYLNELIKHDNALRTLASPQIFIQAWLRCSFLHEERASTELSDVAGYLCSHYPNNRFFKKLTISKGDVFIDFIKAFRSEFDLCSSALERKRLRDEDAAVYFGILEKWSSEVLQNLDSQSQNEVLRIYERAGFLISEVGVAIYTQLGSRTLLHRLLDIFLLPQQVRDPAYNLHPFISKALHHNLNLFIQGLVKLGANNDAYVLNAVKDTLSLLMPRLVRKSGALNDTCETFSLLKCFTECRHNVAPREDCCIVILQTVAERLIKKRFRKNEPNHTLQAIAFIADVASITNKNQNKHQNKAHTVQCILDCCLESVASVAMFYDKGEPCQKNAERLINGILTIHIVLTDPNVRQSAMNLFSKLCRDHLAFYSLKLFDLFAMIAGRVPELFKHFLPQLIQHVETVEKKRGGTYDVSLRDKGVKRIEQILTGG